jgi:hypothetical protein
MNSSHRTQGNIVPSAQIPEEHYYHARFEMRACVDTAVYSLHCL